LTARRIDLWALADAVALADSDAVEDAESDDDEDEDDDSAELVSWEDDAEDDSLDLELSFELSLELFELLFELFELLLLLGVILTFTVMLPSLLELLLFDWFWFDWVEFCWFAFLPFPLLPSWMVTLMSNPSIAIFRFCWLESLLPELELEFFEAELFPDWEELLLDSELESDELLLDCDELLLDSEELLALMANSIALGASADRLAINDESKRWGAATTDPARVAMRGRTARLNNIVGERKWDWVDEVDDKQGRGRTMD
jgi:hypothetical protein